MYRTIQIKLVALTGGFVLLDPRRQTVNMLHPVEKYLIRMHLLIVVESALHSGLVSNFFRINRLSASVGSLF